MTPLRKIPPPAFAKVMAGRPCASAPLTRRFAPPSPAQRERDIHLSMLLGI